MKNKVLKYIGCVLLGVMLVVLAILPTGMIIDRANSVIDGQDEAIEQLRAKQGIIIECLDDQIAGLLENKQAWEKVLGLPEICLEYLPAGYAETWANKHLKSDKPKPKPKPKPLTLPEIVQQVMPGVVHIQCPQGQSSGFVISPNLIGTARHIVEGVEDFEITTFDNHKLHATRAISNKKHDTGFIWVDDLVCTAEKCEYKYPYGFNVLRGEHKVKSQVLELGSIKDCVLGQDIFAIGSPYGKMNFNSVTTGIISGIDREWDIIDPWTGEEYGWKVAFTTDSAGHPGNSGCPLFTMDGKVRGILVGGPSPVLICVMPCDLFLSDLELIKSMFGQDRYQREVVMPVDYYYLPGSGLGY